MSRVERIRARLTESFAPIELSVEDDSARHAGHPGARSGLGHFNVRIVSEQFRDVPPLKRHQLVYGALDDMMKTDIHALSLVARAPD
jgi:BolA protein